jgi:2-polyprenyl-3-methyl-5-hydroxy-6-metoxy-1,4-benzoquinol methylase
MPYSSSEGKGFFKDWLFHMMAAKHIRTIMDIGAGSGGYADIVKQGVTDAKQWNPELPDSYILNGCEIYKKYIDQFKLQTKYHNIFNIDAFTAVQGSQTYDLYILGDVLEHLEKDKAIELVNLIKQKSKFIYISTPVKPFKPWVVGYNQSEEEWRENIYEKHLYYWSHDELMEFKPLWIVPFLVVEVIIIEGDLAK